MNIQDLMSFPVSADRKQAAGGELESEITIRDAGGDVVAIVPIFECHDGDDAELKREIAKFIVNRINAWRPE